MEEMKRDFRNLSILYILNFQNLVVCSHSAYPIQNKRKNVLGNFKKIFFLLFAPENETTKWLDFLGSFEGIASFNVIERFFPNDY